MIRRRFPPFQLLLLLCAACGTPRPPTVTLPVTPERDSASPFAKAVARGTRSWTGAPGPHYWQQYARYQLSATIDPGHTRLSGTERVVYLNRSPDTLRDIAIQLYQNIGRMDAPRDESMPLNGGVTLSRVQVGEVALAPVTDGGSGYRVDGTIGWIRLPTPLLPSDSVVLSFAWGFKVPWKGGPRMGQDNVTFFLGQWYPQIAVYDDVIGWQTDQYLGIAEFYMDYADYDVSVTVPDNWIVGATGDLVNSDDVLTQPTRERLTAARHDRRITAIVGPGEQGAGRATQHGSNGWLTWHYTAAKVRDFAFGASSDFRWDAAAAVVGDRDGGGTPDTTLVEALYRPYRPGWPNAAKYVQHGIEFFSRYLWPYPYSHMTAVEGIVNGGMEYPMITIAGGELGSELYAITVHEVGHMWFPMLVGSDEKRYAWMDEGLTEFNQTQAQRDFEHNDAERDEAGTYMSSLSHGVPEPLIKHGDAYSSDYTYTIASYYKPVAIMRALRGVLGDSTFLAAYREYGRRWTNRHPYPQDFWNTFSNVAGQDLGWFWRDWFMETWTLDQAIGAVTPIGNDSLAVVIENRDRAVMPVPLAITRSDGSLQRLTLSASVWFDGVTQYTVHLADQPRITRIEIDPDRLFPDVHRGNNRWSR